MAGTTAGAGLGGAGMNCADAVDERDSDATIAANAARIPDEGIDINVTGRGNRVGKLEPQQANCLLRDCHPSMQMRQARKTPT